MNSGRGGKISSVPFLICSMIFLFLAIYSGLRNVDIGADTQAYSDEYEIVSSGTVLDRGSESLFSYMMVATSSVGLEFRGFLLLCSFFFYASILYLIRYFGAERGWFVYILFFLFSGLFAFGLSGLRQVVAISVFVFSVSFLLKEKYYLYFALGFVAFFIHNSSIVPFFFACMLMFFRINKIQFFLLILLTPSFAAFNNGLISFFDFIDIKQLKMSYETDEQFLNIKVPLVTWIIFLLISGLLCVGSKNYKFENGRELNFLMWSSVFMISFLWMAMSVRLVERFSLYFVPAAGVLIALTFQGEKKSVLNWVVNIALAIFLIAVNIYILRDYF